MTKNDKELTNEEIRKFLEIEGTIDKINPEMIDTYRQFIDKDIVRMRIKEFEENE